MNKFCLTLILFCCAAVLIMPQAAEARDGPGRLPRPRPIRPIPHYRPRGRRSAEPRRTGQD
ncbi:hypothetical protein DPMN_137304 [Dreissena polymorpha]|uniref:Uncharacterized protein n=1 Tax=Dreissena polymorpha TaxID=45954 RepID=A0A9D4JIP6_DREPO|nr:hypothetical protein DPMN_137304 [Dreissena polymorpha]